jgi:hypothetical protein
LKWKVQAGEILTGPPVIASNLICIQGPGTVAFELASGKLAWRAGLGGAVQSVPVITEQAMYVASLNGDIYALE